MAIEEAVRLWVAQLCLSVRREYFSIMSEMLQLRTWLIDSEPEVWRRLVVDPRLTMEQLHTVLQIAFGWENAHLHQFHERDGTRYGRAMEFDTDVIDERKLCLGKVFDRTRKKIAYEYDFGDSWIHAVQLEKKVDGEKLEYPFETFVASGRGVFSGKTRAAICIAGARNGPPEDCGGLGGYFDMLALKRDAKAARSAEKRELLEWLGDWDPESFDLAEINEYLGRVRVKKAYVG
jgi:hypothetical protein